MSCPVFLYIDTVFYHNNTIVQLFDLRYSMSNMQTHYLQFLKQKQISKDLLDFASNLETEAFKNISRFQIEKDPDSYSLYTFCRVNENKSVSTDLSALHIILPGIDFGLSSHLFTAWDILLEQALISRNLCESKEFLIISPLSAIGSNVTVKSLDRLKKEGLKYIANIYTNWILHFLKNSNRKYNKIILHGMSAGASYALIVGTEMQLQKINNIKLVLDNPSLLVNNSPLRFLQIPIAFFLEGVYRVFFDENVKGPISFEKNFKLDLAKRFELDKKDIKNKIARNFAIKLIQLFIMDSTYKNKANLIHDCIYNIGKYDFTIIPFLNKKLVQNAKVNFLEEGHYFNRLRDYFSKA